jgi:hypothetical protein
MNFRLELICVKEDGTEERREVLTITKEQLAMETLGLTVAEGKALLSAVQTCVVEEQATTYLAQRRACATCGKPQRSKERRRSTGHTVFGPVAVPNPRWHRCACQERGPLTFGPTAQWLTGHTGPDLLYLETKWASLLPYAGDTISTAFVESTINHVVSKRFVKRQQMQWSQKGAPLLFQTRPKVLDGDLEEVFRGWYPQFRSVSTSSPTP